MRSSQKIINKLSAIRLQNKIFFTYSLVFLLMFAVIFGIASILIDRTFSEQLDKEVVELQSNISNNYTLFVNSIRTEVQAKGEDKDTRNAVERAQSGNSRYISVTNFDVFECGNTEGILVLSNRTDEQRYGDRVIDITNATTELSYKDGKGTIRERVIESGDDPQLVVEVTQWWDWGYVTGGRSLQKWLRVEMLSQPSEHPIFLVKRKDEQEEWIPLNSIAYQTPTIKMEWGETEASTSGGRETN